MNKRAQEAYEYHLEEAADNVQRIITSASVAALTLIVIAVFLNIGLTRSIVTPIKSLSYRAKQIAEGNLAVERMNIKRKDEIGGLNESFNQMTDQLISLIQEISHVSSQVESFSVQLDDENKKLMESANQVSVSTDEMANGSQAISEDLQHGVSLIERMDSHGRKNSERSHTVIRSTEDAIEAVESGKHTLTETKAAIEKIHVRRDKLKSLQENSLSTQAESPQWPKRFLILRTRQTSSHSMRRLKRQEQEKLEKGLPL